MEVEEQRNTGGGKPVSGNHKPKEAGGRAELCWGCGRCQNRRALVWRTPWAAQPASCWWTGAACFEPGCWGKQRRSYKCRDHKRRRGGRMGHWIERLILDGLNLWGRSAGGEWRSARWAKGRRKRGLLKTQTLHSTADRGVSKTGPCELLVEECTGDRARAEDRALEKF